jgi:hypothetical protein
MHAVFKKKPTEFERKLKSLCQEKMLTEHTTVPNIFLKIKHCEGRLSYMQGNTPG